jgi:hypothetical protein
MIDNEATFNKFGYYANDLKLKSSKRIVVVCDRCGKVREVYKFSYCDLCNSCAQKIVQNKPEIKEANRQRSLGRTLTSQQKENHIIKMKSLEVRQKMSDNHADFNGNKNPNYGKGLIGNKNGRWNGGISFGKYCYKFNNQLKQSIRDRYNNCDYISGLPQKYFKRKLDVHHIDYDKDQGCNDKKFNLIPLSISNHTRTNANRSFWNRLFKYSLEIDKWYYNNSKINIWGMI